MEFVYHSPTKVYFGEGKITVLGEEILKYCKKVLLVYGKGSIKSNGVYDAVCQELQKHNIDVVELSGVAPNPRISTVREGVSICKKENIDLVLAVGGGSVIDCAKGIAVGAKYDGDPWDYYTKSGEFTEKLPVGTILTLSATGSELNGGSVITNLETSEKMGRSSELGYPEFSILDPTYTYTVNKHQTACGVVDTLAHLYEFYFSNNVADVTDEICEAIMRKTIEYGPIALKEPENYEARSNLMWCSSLALQGIVKLGKTFDGFNHGLEHVISGLTDLTHADGLAIIATHWMGYILEHKSEENPNVVKKLSGFGRRVWQIEGDDDYDVAKETVKAVSDYYQSLHMPLKLKDVDIDATLFEEILNRFMVRENTGKFVTLNKEDVKEILNRML